MKINFFKSQIKFFCTKELKDLTLFNVSPLDGRYKNQVSELKDYLSIGKLEENRKLIRDQINKHQNSLNEDNIKLISNSLILFKFLNKCLIPKYDLLMKDRLNDLIKQSSPYKIDRVYNSIKSNDPKERISLARELVKYQVKLGDNQETLKSEINLIFSNLGVNDIDFNVMTGESLHVLRSLSETELLKNSLSRIFSIINNHNTILICFSRDMWGYISRGIFSQKIKAGEIGSSTMPHKVNPIDFENAEGNLGVSNAYINCFIDILNQSRFQGDGLENVIFENMGSSFGYIYVSYESLMKGLNKLTPNQENVFLH